MHLITQVTGCPHRTIHRLKFTDSCWSAGLMSQKLGHISTKFTRSSMHWSAANDWDPIRLHMYLCGCLCLITLIGIINVLILYQDVPNEHCKYIKHRAKLTIWMLEHAGTVDAAVIYIVHNCKHSATAYLPSILLHQCQLPIAYNLKYYNLYFVYSRNFGKFSILVAFYCMKSLFISVTVL